MPRELTTEDAAGMPPAWTRAWDDVLGLHALFLVIPREESVYFRLVVESWEDYAVARTMHRFLDGDPRRSVVVVMAVDDFLAPCLRRLQKLCVEIGGEAVEGTDELRRTLRRDLLDDAPTQGAGEGEAASISSSVRGLAKK